MGIVTTDASMAYRRVVQWWAAVCFPAAFTSILMGNYFLIYATDVLLIAPAAIGTLLALSRIYDGISDIALAGWSDRLSSRFGRRRPFVLAGGMTALCFGAFWLPPESYGATATIVWVGVMLIVWETATTLIHVPTQALGIEVGQTPQRRTFDMTLGLVLGLPCAIAANFLIQHLVDSADARAAGAPWFLGLGFATAAIVLVMSWRLKELPVNQHTVERNFPRMLREVLRVGYHRDLIAVQLCETFAFTSLAFSVPYVMTYILDRPGQIVIIFVSYLVVSNLSQLGWLALIPRMGMKRIWLAGLRLWMGVFVAFPLVFILGFSFYLALAIVAGLAGGAAAVNYAMLGDIADYDARRSGRQRQGIYMTIYRLVAKIGGAATAFILGWSLQLSGFVPNADQGQMTIAAIATASSIVPLLGVLVGFHLLKRYDLYRAEGISDRHRPLLEDATIGGFGDATHVPLSVAR